MDTHLYEIGQAVIFTRDLSKFTSKAAELYTIRAQLPPVGDNLQYRIKSAVEPFERVAPEYQLSAAESDAVAADASPALATV